MEVEQWLYQNSKWEKKSSSKGFNSSEHCLLLVFADAELCRDKSLAQHLKQLFPQSDIICCSTAGEIWGDKVFEHSMVVSALQFSQTNFRCASVNLEASPDSFTAAESIVTMLMAPDLSAILVFGDGMNANGSELVTGFNDTLKKTKNDVLVSGGQAADGARFEKTLVGLNEVPSDKRVVAVGFYGENLQVGHGSLGGWDEFGPERVITKASKNTLYEIDHRNALELYKEYLGPYRKELPGSALLFPLAMKQQDSPSKLVRTILSINEEDQSMVFAGNLPEGSTVRLMKANFSKLIEASAFAATAAKMIEKEESPSFILLVSCVGRKLVLQERTMEEVEAVHEIFGSGIPISGWYSYGEISPTNFKATCELHNQTMTITSFYEKAPVYSQSLP